MSETLKAGTTLIATTEIMFYPYKYPAVIAGKEYKISTINNIEFAIKNEENTDHYFTLAEKNDAFWKKFFTIKKDTK